MDNWGTFLLVNVVLVVVLGILTNLVTPWVKSSYDKSVFSSKKLRIQTSIEEYRLKKSLYDKPAFIAPYTKRYSRLRCIACCYFCRYSYFNPSAIQISDSLCS